MSNREYNFMYEELVKNDKDFVGMMAYSIYKKQKVAYCKEFYTKNGRGPTNDELKSFHDSINSGIEGYRAQAKNLNEVYQKILFKEKSEDILTLYKRHLPTKKSYWHGVGQNIIASFIYSLLLILFFIILNNRFDLIDLLNN